mgnify:CR=1 FL=1
MLKKLLLILLLASFLLAVLTYFFITPILPVATGYAVKKMCSCHFIADRTQESIQKDDLKKISGVGPVLEGKLNDMGIFTYAQVSKMTKEEYDLLDQLTGSFPGRAERDDWAKQATDLMNQNNDQ